MSKELVNAMKVLEAEKGIKPEIIKEALESALILAYKKNYDQAQNVEVVFNEETGDIKVFSVKEVVDINYDSTLEISLEEALKINRAYEIGDKIKFEVTPKDFGRIATQTAKHVVMQRIREAERDIIYDEFIVHQDEILTGTIERSDARNIYVNLGKVEAIMPASEQIPTEQFQMDERVKVYVVKVDKTSKGPQIVVSRSHADFLKRLFEQEVPEIYQGVVEIISIAREAGDRSKVAVYSRDSNIDPVGTCVGPRGSRVQSIVNELNGENMDIIQWDEDPAIFIKNAMNPAEVLKVVFDEENHSCVVVVPDYQLSLAIGKKGQNARLAARLTGYKIDIKSETSFAEYLLEQENKTVENELSPKDQSLNETPDPEDQSLQQDLTEASNAEGEDSTYKEEDVVDQIEE
ncbi:transcription termination factor NusA [Facklamia miroungae]|uniref:Transcription termination/antitermination protein NusA n=1 Tax=Facklamia miroungae TaxID=120956 RepID=A0A1G7P405_9LACT|nr:transcription termination factor NusA [Facklamia miroungae]NKZ28571.1 transcription termination/antitermination protein NusA [Facklamia miroungae]SDF80954.1 N utilization substance protein A [Facklamia miroungae]